MSRINIENKYIEWWMGAEVIPPGETKSYSCIDVKYYSQPSGFYGVVELTLSGYGKYIVSPLYGKKRPNKSDVKVL